jgi:hypothetical protein
MAAIRKFSAEQQNKIIAQLEAPFDEHEIKWHLGEARQRALGRGIALC